MLSDKFPNWTNWKTWKNALFLAGGACMAVAADMSLPHTVHLVAVIGGLACSGAGAAVVTLSGTAVGPTVVKP